MLILMCRSRALVLLILQIKFENNGIIGTIPPELGSIKRLRRFQAGGWGWLSRADCAVQQHTYCASMPFQCHQGCACPRKYTAIAQLVTVTSVTDSYDSVCMQDAQDAVPVILVGLGFSFFVSLVSWLQAATLKSVHSPVFSQVLVLTAFEGLDPSKGAH
jgi:hypothetical protein